LDIAFVVIGQKQVHEGVVRPFVNFAKGLHGKYKFFFLLLDCSRSFSESLQNNSVTVVDCKNKKELIGKVQNLKPTYIFADDDLQRLRLLKELKKVSRAKMVIYVQILYGSHVVADCFDLSSQTLKEKIVYGSIRHLPFSFFSQRYAGLLRSFDLVIANSKITATLLHSLYDVEVGGVIYPPVDTEVFQPSDQKNDKELVLYLGSHLGDVKQSFVKSIVETVQGTGFEISLFGNRRIGSFLLSKYGDLVTYSSELSDIDLAKMYSRSKITLCPQKWEQFGYVPVESMACGTPVLAFNCMGFQETIDSSAGWLANNEKEYLQILAKELNQDKHVVKETRQKILKDFSSGASGQLLDSLLEKYFRQNK
jgi:glycosyltransferase involved in cell wall biosynthesis